MLPAPEATGVHVATPVGPVDTFGQVVAVKLLLELAETGVQDEIGVGPVVTVLQVVVV